MQRNITWTLTCHSAHLQHYPSTTAAAEPAAIHYAPDPCCDIDRAPLNELCGLAGAPVRYKAKSAFLRWTRPAIRALVHSKTPQRGARSQQRASDLPRKRAQRRVEVRLC